MQVRPDPSSDLGDGIVVQAQLLGRVLGIRLLRVDGTVLLSPAGPAEPGERPVAAPPYAGGYAGYGDGYAAGELAEAARLLRESDETLKRW